MSQGRHSSARISPLANLFVIGDFILQDPEATPENKGTDATENNGRQPEDLQTAELDSIYSELNTTPEGLTKAEADSRLQKYGANSIQEKEQSALARFFRFFWGPIPWMIEAAALLSALIGHWPDFAIIMALLLYNAIAGFWQEHKAANALAALKASMAPRANILRDGDYQSIDAAQVVPGDIVRIKLGQVVPADVRFIEGKSISIDQAALTGESLPVSKKIGDIGYSSSIAKRGEMTAVVIGTGHNTFFGRTATLVAGAGQSASHSQKAVTHIGDFLIVLCLVLAVILVGTELYRDIVVADKWHWSDIINILRTVLVLLIASIPVAMPSVITVTNALGALALSRKKAIVSRLEAIEELAGVDILCSDKTGTLTKNQLCLEEPTVFSAEDKNQLILAAAIASEQGSTDPIDQAIFAELSSPIKVTDFHLKEFTPFDPVSKRTEAKVMDNKGKTLFFSKGAPQAIADLCQLSGDAADNARSCVQQQASRGLRSLGVARKESNQQWLFLGILSLEDPPRDDSKDTIRRAREHGLQVKMITGDDVAIGKEIATQVGIGTNIYAAANVFEKSQDMDHLPSATIDCVERADGFGRVFPEHKYAIVKALQGRGHQVAMTGDGVNDAPALKQADCGIAVSGATDAARAAAAIILTSPGLSTIVDAIDEARKIFERIINYVLFRVSMTLDIMVVVVAATIIFGFSPLTPVMIVLVALLDDIPIMTIAYDNTLLPKQPVHWQMRDLLLGSSIIGLFSIAQTMGILFLGMAWLDNTSWQSWIALNKEQIQTIVFLQIVAGGHLLLFVVRSRTAFFSKPLPAQPLFVAIVGTQAFTVLMCGLGWLVPAIPWSIIGLVWLYMIIWMFFLDLIKRLLYRRLSDI
ncbi:plasma-membrane proton-efflux P-type ATPase [Microbulbifer sp. OS29]|uniref:Plasma-membrane proton-efflux P-type ATPase n=1 Tax=Microbulbifer okhotskensis TaxID=2926617 RepID=A0A9X2ES76_9GAMM|nr:plasma-membrane proton-efflux P-type ATPase [Microbulbifer okhotskensis]MCO1334638.1 plasma-membrane proton-efflux P-type ATPase [Microbulbifer okhotskensis]